MYTLLPSRLRAPVGPAMLLALFAIGWSSPAAALPDLTPEIFDVAVHTNRAVDPGDVIEGCTTAGSGRKLIDFSIRTRNIGSSDLNIGPPGCPDCSTNPNAPCGNPLFVCSAAHGHPHFNGFAKAELLSGATVVAIGRKQGFCLLDSECPNPQFSCGNQGISKGCSDVYGAFLPCQYIDITDANLPDGDYTLRVTLDPDGAIAEDNEANNAATAPVHIGAIPPPPLGCPVVMSTDVPKPIADLATVESTLAVTMGGPVSRVRVVDLKGAHTYVSDLEVHLVSPQGTDVDVLHAVCGDNDNFDIDLADAGDPTLQCPPTSGQVARPYRPLSAFNGQPAAGTWKLRVVDRAAADTGTLQSWGLEVCTSCGNGTLEAGEVCDDGNSLDGDCCSANCANASNDGAACGLPSQCLVGTCAAGQCVGNLSCDGCLTCVPGQGCQPPPNAFCEGAIAGDSWVALKRNATDARRDTLGWALQSGSPVARLDFGNPPVTTDMHLCVFDQRGLQLSLEAPAGGRCGSGDCWMPTALGYRYSDPQLTPDGIGRLQLQSGDAYRARMSARGRGANLALPDLSLQMPVTVRLQRSGGPACWEASYPSAVRNEALQFKAKR
jgi:cysteine-rich repeat protein